MMKVAISLVSAYALSAMATSATVKPPSNRVGTTSIYARYTGNFMGYLTRGSSPNNSYFTVTTNKTQGMIVNFVQTYDGIPFNINLPNGGSNPEFGAAVGPVSAGSDLLPGSPNYALLTATAQTPAGQVAAASCGPAAESQIWLLDNTTGQFAPRWLNSNGSAPDVLILLSADSAQNLYLTGDVASFEASYGTNFYSVDMFFDYK